MKKIYTFIFAALAFAASCTPSVEPDGEGNPPIGSQVPIIMKSYTITATKDADTKVSVADDGSQVTSVTWEEGDVIRVYNANEAWDVKGYEATMTSGAGKTSATFTFEAPEDRKPGFFVVYGTTATLAEDKVNIDVPATVPGSAKPILAGYTSSDSSIGSVDLQAVCAYMKVTLNEKVNAVRFFAVNNASEKLAGTVTFGTEGIVSTTPASEPILTVNNPSTTFYVNILPGTLTQGYIIDVVKGTEHMIKSAGYGKSKTFGTRFSKLDLPAFTAAVTLDIKTSYQPNPDNTYANDKAKLTATLNLPNALKEANLTTFEGYDCNGIEKQQSGEFTGLKPKAYPVSAKYNFTCGSVDIPLVASSTAIITGLPYSYIFSSSSKNYNANETTQTEKWTLNNTGTQSNQLWIAQTAGGIGHINKEFYVAEDKSVNVTCTTVCKFYIGSGTVSTAIYIGGVKDGTTQCSKSDKLSPEVSGNNNTNGYRNETTSSGSTNLSYTNHFLCITSDGVKGGITIGGGRHLYIHSIEVKYKTN